MRRTYTADQKNKIVLEFRAGETAAVVGKRHGISGAMVYQWNKQSKELGGFKDPGTPASKKGGKPRQQGAGSALVQAAQDALLAVPTQRGASNEQRLEYENRFMRTEIARLRGALQAYMLGGGSTSDV